MSQDLTWNLKVSFEHTAEWRHRVALEHPNDERNVKAADALERLASTVDQVDTKLLAVFEEKFADEDSIFLLNEMLRQIGFHTDYVDAADFVQDFIDEALRKAA
jgi:hypothetical protein